VFHWCARAVTPLEEFPAVFKDKYSQGASAISIESDIISADQHGTIGFEPSSVQLLGSSEFYQLPVRIKYSSQRRLGKVARPNRIFQRGDGEDAQHALMTRLM
jgi:hypothetical protein